MDPKELLSDEFTVRWDPALDSIVIAHPDAKKFPQPHVQIRAETLSGMSFEEASQFIGERLVLLIPALHERYVDPTTVVLREPPEA